MSELCAKSRILTAYLEYLLNRKYGDQCNGDVAKNGPVHVTILSPLDPDQRGAQLSLSFSIDMTRVFKELEKRGVVVSNLGLLLEGNVGTPWFKYYCLFQCPEFKPTFEQKLCQK